MADFEVYLSQQGQGKWRVVGTGDRGGTRQGSALILEATQQEVTSAITGKVTLDAFPPWYQGHLTVKGFVGITLAELKRILGVA